MSEMRIVIVDDEPVNLMLLEEIAKIEGYRPTVFMNPRDAIEHLSTHRADLLITDYNMPQMHGIDLLRSVRDLDPEMMSIMITANGEESVRIEALKEGVTDFLTKPLQPTEFTLRMKNILRIREGINLQKEFSKQLSAEVQRVTEALRESEYETLRVLSKTAEYKDPETGSHVARVAHYSKLLGQYYGLNEAEQNILFYAAPLHDIGKVGIEDAVLLKPGKLSSEEFQTMQTHSQIGYEILAEAKNPYLAAGGVIARSHHEKYNGKGYPLGLKGEAIPLYGRIVAIADVFDALTSVRPYKRPWSFEEALELIRSEEGEHFDPVLVGLFIDHIDEIREVYHRFEE